MTGVFICHVPDMCNTPLSTKLLTLKSANAPSPQRRMLTLDLSTTGKTSRLNLSLQLRPNLHIQEFVI